MHAAHPASVHLYICTSLPYTFVCARVLLCVCVYQETAAAAAAADRDGFFQFSLSLSLLDDAAFCIYIYILILLYMCLMLFFVVVVSCETPSSDVQCTYIYVCRNRDTASAEVDVRNQFLRKI